MTFANHVYTAEMTIGPEREALFNEVYDREHIPALRQARGVLGVRRYRRIEPAAPFYLALYEVTGPDVPLGTDFSRQRDVGRWPSQIRPFLIGVRNGSYARREGWSSAAAPVEGGGGSSLLLLVRGALEDSKAGALDGLLDAVRTRPASGSGARYEDVDDGSFLVLAAFDRAVDAVAEAVAAGAAAPAGSVVEVYEPRSTPA